VRLAVGGGRTSWSRVVLGTIGIGLDTTVLLLFASVGHMLGNANARIAAGTPSTVAIAGVHPTQLFYNDMSFHGVSINDNYLHGTALWQTAVPVALAVVVAVGIGIGIAGLVIRMVDLPLRVDWPTIGVFAAAAVALVFAMTALTLPALRGATRLAAMRTE
jgi:hypothetical protein